MDDKSTVNQPLIQDYELQLVCPPCLPGAETWNAKAALPCDITEALPYLNATLKGADYDSEAQVLVWKKDERKYAARPSEIMVAPVKDKEEAQDLIDEWVAIINETWKQRESITPDFSRRKLPTVMEIYKLLPGTNCRECGCLSCLAFATSIRSGKAKLSQCHALLQETYAQNKSRLSDMLGE